MNFGWSVCLCSRPPYVSRVHVCVRVYKQNPTVQGYLVYIFPTFESCQHTVETAVAHRHSHTDTHLDMFMVEVLCL